MSGLHVALDAAGWALGFVLLCRLRRPAEVEGPVELAAVAVVVPARDEAATIGALLASLGGQRSGAVVVVDDESTDATAAIAAAHAGTTVVAAGVRPDGWQGKPWACHLGAIEARRLGASELVFVDADAAFEPGGLARVVGERRRHGGLVSVQPHHVTERVYEGLSLLPNLVSMMAVDAFGPLAGRVAPSGAFGPCLSVDVDTYDRLGGHQAVRSEVTEDVALCVRAREVGVPVRVLAGRGSIRFRMYGGGPAGLVDGWTRALGPGVGSVRMATLAAVVAWISVLAGVPVELTVDVAAGRTVPAACAGISYAAIAAQLWWLGRRIGSFPGWTWAAFPVTVTCFVVLFLRSLLRVLTRRPVRWKGRVLRSGGG